MSNLTGARCCACAAALFAASFSCTGFAEHDVPSYSADDPGAPVPATTYKSVLPGTSQAYLKETDAPRLPWKELFTDDGRFVPESQLRGESQSAAAAPTPPAAQTTDQAKGDVPTGSDARAIIRGIDRESGRVRLEHGPIEKLGMPGMTMSFPVKDPALLDEVEEGQDVGVTFEVEGARSFVTGFQQ